MTLCLAASFGLVSAQTSETLPEARVKETIRVLLTRHLPYAESQFVATAGYFGNGQSVEHGARTNADYALVYAFIYKKCKDQKLPNGLTFETVKKHALAAIRYSYKTHKTGTVNCTNGVKWGLVWESSLWCTSTAFASWLMADELTSADKAAIKKMVLAEADHNLFRTIPTAISSDTKAEENGWDTNILAIAAALYPEEMNAEAWTLKCKQFAVNTYSVDADAYRNDSVKDLVDGRTIAEWHIGGNLFPDYALENHHFFHTSYLNVPIQELSESLLAYKALQNATNPVFPIPNALRHNVRNVWNSMLKEFIMADGILAMPNGNDWSMYINDELATYSALACIYRDPDALMLESMVLQNAKFRQSTTPDGAFLLNPDVAERRMAVTARRLVFAHLYHDFFPTNGLVASKWTDFSKRHETTKLLPYNGIIRSSNAFKFVTFSWFQSQDGTSYKSYMGIVSPNDRNKSNTVFPLKSVNLGNFTGSAEVRGFKRNASLITNSYSMYPKSFSTTGILSVNAGSMLQYLSFYTTPGNATIYHEDLVGSTVATMTRDFGLMQGITTDVLTQPSRTLFYEGGSVVCDGNSVNTIPGHWTNVDDEYGMVVHGGNGIAFGEKELTTSVFVSKLYGSYSTISKAFNKDELIFSRSSIVYPKVTAVTTQKLATKEKYPTVATGWKATAAEDPDGRRYLLMSNFRSIQNSTVTLSYPEGAPVFDRVTTVTDSTGTASFNCTASSSATNELYVFIKTGALPLKAVQGDSPYSVYVTNENATAVSLDVSIWDNGTFKLLQLTLQPNDSQFIQMVGNDLTVTAAPFLDGYRNISRGKFIMADNQLPEHFPFAMLDDDDSTWFQSITLPTEVTPQNITCSLYNLNAFNQLQIKSVEGIGPKKIQIQTSTDGISFVTVGAATLLNTAEWQTVNYTESDGLYFRIKIISSYGSMNVGIASLRMFGYPK